MLIQTTTKFENDLEARDSLAGLKTLPGFCIGYVAEKRPGQWQVITIFNCSAEAGDYPEKNQSRVSEVHSTVTGLFDSNSDTPDEYGQTPREFTIASNAARCLVNANKPDEFIRTFGNQIVNASKRKQIDAQTFFELLKSHFEAALQSFRH